MAVPDCPNCRAVQHVQDQATSYRCQNCGTDVVFLTCGRCGTVNGVVATWASFVCRSCGKTSGVAGNRLDRVAGGLEAAGDFLSTAGSTLMWLVVVIVMVFFFKACGIF
jgi:predicted RNA-binding Zn-ribbon protein involved in translation (DUF1610 family)